MAPNYGLQQDTSKIALKNPPSQSINTTKRRVSFFLGFARKKLQTPPENKKRKSFQNPPKSSSPSSSSSSSLTNRVHPYFL
jgi:hypothetical protein